jgi:hypothetical protein
MKTPKRRKTIDGWVMRRGTVRAHLPAENRKSIPLATGLFDYFPDALVAVAKVSHDSNAKHNPGEPLGWSREKSNDHTDCMLRHFLDRGALDDDNLRHTAKMAWRALAILQLEIEASYDASK